MRNPSTCFESRLHIRSSKSPWLHCRLLGSFGQRQGRSTRFAARLRRARHICQRTCSHFHWNWMRRGTRLRLIRIDCSRLQHACPQKCNPSSIRSYSRRPGNQGRYNFRRFQRRFHLRPRKTQRAHSFLTLVCQSILPNQSRQQWDRVRCRFGACLRSQTPCGSPPSRQ